MAPAPPHKYSDPVATDKRFQTVKCYQPPRPPRDKYYPYLMPIELVSVHKRQRVFDGPVPVFPPTSCSGCSMAPVGGTSMYGAFYRSGYSCNSCNGERCGGLDVCNRPSWGCNNSACSSWW